MTATAVPARAISKRRMAGPLPSVPERGIPLEGRYQPATARSIGGCIPAQSDTERGDTLAPEARGRGAERLEMTDLEFRMLGPLEVLRHGEAVTLPPGLPRALLGLLLVHANTVVATDRLLSELWRGDPPRSA